MEEPLQLREKSHQGLLRRAIERGRDIAVVDHDILVGAHLDDAGKAEAHISRALARLEEIAQAQLADLHRCFGIHAGDAVDDLHLACAIARADIGAAADRAGAQGLDAAGLTHGKRQIDHRVARIFRQIERRRVIGILGNTERRAVIENAATMCYREFPDGEELAVELDALDAPGMRADAADAPAHEMLYIAIELLEMLRPEEHALGPNDFIIPGHRGAHEGSCSTR